MTSRFKKLAIGSGVAIALAGASLPASAAVLGGAGEALLIPLAVWSGGHFTDPTCTNHQDCDFTLGYTPAVDTVVEVFVPASVGFDAIPNIYTAQNTTPTNTPTALTPADPDLAPAANPAIHWYWFDKRSVEIDNRMISVTPDDVVQLSLTELANGQNEDVPGYMVIANHSARNGTKATFSIFANAWLTGAIHFDGADGRFHPGLGLPLIGASIPVLAMNDGADAAPPTTSNCPQPDALDSVTYKGGVPCAVSPVIAGFRTNRSDGAYDLFAFDLAMSNRLVPTIHVLWFDQNLATTSGAPNQAAIDALYPGNTAFVDPLASIDVFDLEEFPCSTTIPLPNELNVLWIPPAYETNEDTLLPWNQPWAWTTANDLLCVSSDEDPAALFTAGFVQYKMDEYIDTNVDKAESSAFAFSIKVDGGLVSNDAIPFPDAIVLLLESSLGHDLGTFKSF